MSTERAKMVACTIFSSRFDYCNSVHARMSEANFNKLKRVQYALAHVVTGMPAYSRNHMITVLTKLHWLPIRDRVSLEIAMMVFKICQMQQPSYLVKLIEDAVPFSSLRSCNMLSRHDERVKNCVGRNAVRANALTNA